MYGYLEDVYVTYNVGKSRSFPAFPRLSIGCTYINSYNYVLVNYFPYVHVRTALHTHTQLKHCRVGQTVRIINDLKVLQLLCKLWHKDMFVVSKQEQIHVIQACLHYALNAHQIQSCFIASTLHRVNAY